MQITYPCSIFLAIPKSSKESYWKRKERAMNRFKAEIQRPQDLDRSFLLYRRNLNSGEMKSNWLSIPVLSKIKNAEYRIDFGSANNAVPETEYKFFMFIDESKKEELKPMLDVIRQTRELAMDLEGNTDHSYLGIAILKLYSYFNSCFNS